MTLDFILTVTSFCSCGRQCSLSPGSRYVLHLSQAPEAISRVKFGYLIHLTNRLQSASPTSDICVFDCLIDLLKMAGKGPELFKLPIANEGSVVVTQPADKVYLLTFTSPPDNRLVTVGSPRMHQRLC